MSDKRVPPYIKNYKVVIDEDLGPVVIMTVVKNVDGYPITTSTGGTQLSTISTQTLFDAAVAAALA